MVTSKDFLPCIFVYSAGATPNDSRYTGTAWRALCRKLLVWLVCRVVVLELAHRPDDDLDALAEIDSRIALGLGVVDIKVNHVETPDEIATRIENAESRVGKGRVKFVHPDCGFWMLKRSIADRKLEALVKGRDKFLGLG